MNKNKLYKNILIFLCMLPFSKGDTEVSCVFMERCILPCSFTDGAADFIEWIHLSPEVSEVAHRYYNKEKHEDQGQNYTNRTSLFENQISNGNASLQLTGVKIQDMGRYHCYTKTITGIQNSYILLKVDAPVSKISFDQVGNRITCSSNWIYPEPELTWSTSPPSNMSLQNTTSVQQTEQQLYKISSSLILSDSDTDLIYSCTVRTRTSSRRATWRRLPSFHANYTEATISCSASNTSLTSLIWRFNHNQIILNKPGPDVTYTVSEEWRQHVKEVSESGSLTLQDLTSHQEGKYTCELSNSEETMITVICLRMNSENSVNVGGIIGGVFAAAAAAAAAAAVGLLIFRKKRKGQQDNNRRSNNEEINIRMEVQGADEGLISDFCRVSSDDNQMSSPSSPSQFSEADSAV